MSRISWPNSCSFCWALTNTLPLPAPGASGFDGYTNTHTHTHGHLQIYSRKPYLDTSFGLTQNIQDRVAGRCRAFANEQSWIELQAGFKDVIFPVSSTPFNYDAFVIGQPSDWSLALPMDCRNICGSDIQFPLVFSNSLITCIQFSASATLDIDLPETEVISVSFQSEESASSFVFLNLGDFFLHQFLLALQISNHLILLSSLNR